MNHAHSNGMGKHMLLMSICCLVPIALIIAVSVFRLSLDPLTPLVPYALVLMCPFMMIFMMREMMQGQGADHAQHHPSTSLGTETPSVPSNAKGAVEATQPNRTKCH